MKTAQVDRMVRRIFTAMNRHDPDGDPGDLNIRVQDDSPLVEVWLDRDPRLWLSAGDSVQEALKTAVEGLETIEELPGEDNGFRGVLTPLFGAHNEGIPPHHDEQGGEG